MTQKMSPVAVARRMIDAQVARNQEAVFAVMDENIVLHVPGERPTAGTYHGHAGILDFQKKSRAATDDWEHIKVLDVLGGEEYAAVFMQLNATRGGKSLDDPTLWLLRVKDGKIIEFVLYPRDQRKTDAFWQQ